ncbi:hypothetical protein [Enterococcus sp. BWR-S5]|uniref:hypothetical protein n=1 Tax=Enterococcus sp. BWR-S5 TaxID=2787714 RepID=UPI0019218819|nr:hypothetical protein [Enterococcus sp. BWR-S5]MBL1225952.1 hypothetical protein [Enterococcus sp. BWR-S5]
MFFLSQFSYVAAGNTKRTTVGQIEFDETANYQEVVLIDKTEVELKNRFISAMV